MTSDEFLAAFFGPGNNVLGTGPAAERVRERLTPYVEPIHRGEHRPVILPRRTGTEPDAYLICRDRRQAAWFRATVEAFVAHSFVAFDGRVRRLDAADPVENAVLEFVGPDTTYVLRPPDRQNATRMWRALATVNALLDARPQRAGEIQRPIGRLLADFHGALASGNAHGSAVLLDELGGVGVSAVNLAYLRIHRLSRLGRDVEILQSADLGDVIASRPPEVIRDAVLAAWARFVAGNAGESAEELTAAIAQTADSRVADMIPLALGPLASLSGDAVAGVVLMAIATGNRELARGVAGQTSLSPQMRELLLSFATPDPGGAALQSAAPEDAMPAPVPSEPAESEPESEATPQFEEPSVVTSWTEWVSAGVHMPADLVDWREWPAPVGVDVDLASAVENVGDADADRVWTLVGPFLDADDLEAPAWRTARSLLVLAVSYDHWLPTDVATIHPLLEIFLRGSPPADDYRDVLDMLAGSASRWAVVVNALPVLDMVDDVAHAPFSDEDARLRFTLAALEPLSRHRRRLAPELRWLGGQLSTDLDAPLSWEVDASSGADDPLHWEGITARVLIHSLDTNVLHRTAERLASLLPRAVVHQSSDHVGSPQLRTHARSADLIALATRCAKHAATGFIRSQASDRAIIVEADGAGSASLIRCVMAAVSEI